MARRPSPVSQRENTRSAPVTPGEWHRRVDIALNGKHTTDVPRAQLVVEAQFANVRYFLAKERNVLRLAPSHAPRKAASNTKVLRNAAKIIEGEIVRPAFRFDSSVYSFCAARRYVHGASHAGEVAWPNRFSAA